MPAQARDARAVLAQQSERRWRELDPLLPAAGPQPDCGAGLAVAGPAGLLAAAGACAHRAVPPGSLDLTWGAALRFELVPELAGPQVAGPLDRLLAGWRDHLAGVPETAAADSAAIVRWPSRDAAGYQVMHRHGLYPVAVIAARRTRSPGPAVPAAGADPPGAPPPGVRLRRAGPADLDAVVRLGMEEIRFDAYFGCVIERPGSAAALAGEAAGWLAAAPPWVWLAERDGTAVGMVYAQRPAEAGWIAPLVRPGPAAYLEQMAVLPAERGRGVGAALAARLHRDIEQAGAAVTLLHYSSVNPLSVPFWSQQGYRPLWTVFEARPARSLR